VIHLTAAGRKLIRAAFADHAKAMDRATDALNARERAGVIRLLKKLGIEAARR